MMPSAGQIQRGVHYFPVRTYYEDTDAGGIVYHANYLRFAERARSEFMRLLGWPHDHLFQQTGLVWAVRRVEADYRRPARLDDVLMIETRPVELGGASMTARQIIRRGSEELVRLTVQLALLTAAGKPARLPATLKSIFLSLLEVQESADDPCPSIP
jgi:acyl-CoA thioester hydrolase